MRYLSVDFGLKRLGLATSEGELASPLKTIEIKGFKDAVEKVERLIRAEGFKKIIVGLPEGKMGKTVLGFINSLKKRGFDVEYADETLSSQKAVAQMIELNIPKNKRHINDAYSAAIILQNWLDSHSVILNEATLDVAK